MRALFEKDIRLILIRKSTLIIFFIIGIVFSWQFSGTFSGAYITILGTLLALSTLSYDDMDNCMQFLFILPCTRKQYVQEKYLFVYSFSLMAGFLGMAIIILANLVKGNGVSAVMILEIISSELPIMVVTGGLMIPLQLKFGAEKSRIVLMGIMGVLFILVYAIASFSGAKALKAIVVAMDARNPIIVGAVLFVILIVITVVSYMITTKIVEKKEY